LKELGFKQTASNPCLYVCPVSEGELLVVAIYVDDIILGGSCEASQMKLEMSQKFEGFGKVTSLSRCKSDSGPTWWLDLDWSAILH